MYLKTTSWRLSLRSHIVLLLSSLALAAAITGLLRPTVQSAPAPAVRGMTIVSNLTMWNAEGRARPGQPPTIIRAFLADGSEVTAGMRQYPAPGGPWFPYREVTDVPGRRRVNIDFATQSLTTYPMSDKYIAHLPARWEEEATACHDPSASRGTYLGHEIVKRTKSRRYGSSLLRTEVWNAVSLNCALLRKETFLDGRRAFLREAVSVTLGDPAPELFVVPNGYVERSPSEVEAEIIRRFPTFPSRAPDVRRIMEENYWGKRTP
jgi:hypothetical protein